MTKEEKETIEKLTNGEKIDFNTLVRKFKSEGIENFVATKKKYVETVLNMLKKKDNQIDLMADFIRKNITENKLINEICIKGKCQNEECHEDDWKDCIKQYFEKQTEQKGE